MCCRKAWNVKEVTLKCIKYKINTTSKRCLIFPYVASHLRMGRKTVIRFPALQWLLWGVSGSLCCIVWVECPALSSSIANLIEMPWKRRLRRHYDHLCHPTITVLHRDLFLCIILLYHILKILIGKKNPNQSTGIFYSFKTFFWGRGRDSCQTSLSGEFSGLKTKWKEQKMWIKCLFPEGCYLQRKLL